MDFRFIVVIVLIVIVYLLLAMAGCLDEQSHLPPATKLNPTTQEKLAHDQTTVSGHRKISSEYRVSLDRNGLGLVSGNGAPSAGPG